MYVVIVCTVSSGLVRRKYFAEWDRAQRYADHFRRRAPKYRVEVGWDSPRKAA